MSHARKKPRWWIALTESARLGGTIRCVPKPYYGTATCFGLHRAQLFATKREAVAARRRLDLPPRYRATVLPLAEGDVGTPRRRRRAAVPPPRPALPSGLPVVPGTPIGPEELARVHPAEAARRARRRRPAGGGPA